MGYTFPMSLTRAITLNAAIQVFGKVLSTASGILVISLMTRQLGAAGFGAYSTANAFLQVFALAIDLGINVTFPALLGEHAHDETYQKRAFSAVFTLRVLMGGIMLGIVAPLVGFFWPFPWEIKLAIIALALSFLLPSIQQVFIGVQQQQLKTAASAIAENVNRLVLVAGLLASPMLGWGLLEQCLLISLASTFSFCINLFATHKLFPLAWNWDPAFWKILLSRSWPVGLSIGLNLIYYKSDALILQYFRPAEEVGIYGAAYRILEVLISLPFLYAGILLPVLSRTWAEKRLHDMSRLVSRSLDVMILLILPLIAGMYWFGERTLVWISGPEFAPAGAIGFILSFGVAAIYLNTILSHAIVALQAQRRMLPLYGLVALASIFGYMTFIPRFGAVAAAWVTVASESAILVGSIATTLGFFSFRPHTRFLVGGSLAMAGMWIVSHFTQQLPLFISIALSGTAYLACLWMTKTVTPATIRELLALKTPTAPSGV